MLKPEDYRAMAGSQKAAIFMMALGEDQCTRLFAMMHEDEIKDISVEPSQNRQKWLPIWGFPRISLAIVRALQLPFSYLFWVSRWHTSRWKKQPNGA